jgi:hypothetical protein
MADEQNTQPAAATAPAQQPAATSAATEHTVPQPAEQTVPYARFKEVNDRLKALEEEHVKRQKEQEKADEERKKAQGEWQALADQRKAKVDELAPKAELADQLTELINKQVNAEIATWPEQVKNMAPSGEVSVLTMLEWVEKARPLAQELAADKSVPAGNHRGPKPTGPAGAGVREKEARGQHTQWTHQHL